MNINEIRLGNILKAKDNGKWNTVMVTATFNTFVIAKNRFIHLGNTYDPHQLHGAYISIEWLTENGFCDITGFGKEFSFPDSLKLHSDLRLATSNNGTSFYLVNNVNGAKKTIGKEIKCIHTLQNLFMSIVGKELLDDEAVSSVLSLSAPIIDTHTESDL